MASGLPFDDFRNLLSELPGPDEAARNRLRERLAGQELGRLGEIAQWVAAWSATGAGRVVRPLVAVFAGNHGIAASPDTPYDMSETGALVDSSSAGGAVVNGLCAADEIGLRMFDLALDHPTADIRHAAALDERGCAATMAYGMESIAGGVDLIALAGAGAGNRAVAAALLAATLGGPAQDWASDSASAGVAAAALRTHRAHLGDPLEALRRVGGREFAAIAGAVLAARMERIPVILDGAAAIAAAAVLWRANSQALSHCLLADSDGSVTCTRAAGMMGLRPLLDLRLSRSDGAAAALGAGLVRRAVVAVRDVSEAG